VIREAARSTCSSCSVRLRRTAHGMNVFLVFDHRLTPTLKE